MTKQEKIREKLDQVYELFGFGQEQRNTLISTTLACLHSQGVVIKVDREIDWPEYFADEWYTDELGNKITIDDVVRRAGYVAVESLLKEVT